MIRRALAFALVVLTSYLASLGLASAADAQQTTSPRRIGMLLAGASSSAIHRINEALRHLGYDEGRNLTVELRNAENKPERLPDLARELVQLKPDVILTMGTMGPTVAAMKTTNTIPIVFVHAVDPVHTGLVASLSNPGCQCHRSELTERRSRRQTTGAHHRNGAGDPPRGGARGSR
jgi:putative ABC transport system substrate-binding protein